MTGVQERAISAYISRATVASYCHGDDLGRMDGAVFTEEFALR